MKLLILFVITLILTSCANEIGKPTIPKTCDTYTQTDNGIEIACTDGSKYYVSNGKNGIDGQKGDKGDSGKDAVKELINPCGVNPNGFDEVLIRLSDTEILCYFEIGSNRFLSLLQPGLYQTTDTQHCTFRITDDYKYEEVVE